MQLKPYDFSQIRIRLDEIKSHFGYGGDTRLKAETGISGNISEYLEPADSPPRKIKTLAEKLHQKLGINPDWVLFGRGPMLVKDIQGRDSEAKQYEELGRLVAAAINYGVSCGLIDKSTNRQPTVPPARQQAGPGPTVEQVEASRCQGNRSPEI